MRVVTLQWGQGEIFRQQKQQQKNPSSQNPIYKTAMFHFFTTFDKKFLVKRRMKEIYTDLASIALFSSIQMVVWLRELWGRIKMPASMSNCNLEINDYNRRNRDTFPGRVSRQKLKLMCEMWAFSLNWKQDLESIRSQESTISMELLTFLE